MSVEHTPNWKNATAAIALAVLLLCVSIRLLRYPPEAEAQNNGQTGTQTTYRQVFNNQTVTGVSSVIVPNIGASSHWLIYCPTNAGSIAIQIEGSDDNVNWVLISHVGQIATGCSVLQGAGYFQDIRVNLIQLTGGGTQAVSAFYSSSTGPISGNFLGDGLQVIGPIVNPNVTPNVQVTPAGTQMGSNALSAVATLVHISVTNGSVTGNSVAFWHISAVCSAGSAIVQVCDGASPCSIFKYQLPVGTTPIILPFSPPLVGSSSIQTAELTSCGGGNTGYLNVNSGIVRTAP